MEANMCNGNCVKAERKRERVFDILNRLTDEYIYDVPESKLPDLLEDFRDDGYSPEDLKITEEVFIKTIWVINE
jgi:hypothetical protein